VTGVEREARFVEMARAEIVKRGLENVRVVQADGLNTGLEKGAFDLVHERLVMVNLAARDAFVREMLSLLHPGGTIVLADLLRSAGVQHVQIKTTVATPQIGDYRRTHLLSLIESVREKIIASGLLDETALDQHKEALLLHLNDPGTIVIDKLFVQAWGQKPK
jgi:SAM-dependent methyltransferase